MVVLHKSSGPLRYHRGDHGGYKLIVEVDPEIVRYYRSLLPKWIHTNRQMYDPHISTVRNEIPPYPEHWGKYEGEIVEFCYTHTVFHGTIYYWINAFCCRLEEIRVELGLPISSEYTRPPDTFAKVFHITIGNVKGL